MHKHLAFLQVTDLGMTVIRRWVKQYDTRQQG